MALLNQFIDFDPIIDALWVKLEPKFDQLSDKVIALIPSIGAAAAVAIFDRFLKPGINKALEGDPDIPVVSDIFDLSEMIRGAINGDPRIPIHIPGLDILGGLFKGPDHQ